MSRCPICDQKLPWNCDCGKEARDAYWEKEEQDNELAKLQSEIAELKQELDNEHEAATFWQTKATFTENELSAANAEIVSLQQQLKAAK